MGYYFKGFFACADGTVLRDALIRWPECQGWLIRAPFRGIALAAPDPEAIDVDPLDEDRLLWLPT